MTQHRIDICLAAQLFYPTFTGAGMRFQRYAPGLKARRVDMRVFAGTPAKSQKAGGLSEKTVPDGTLLPIENLDGLAVQRVQLSQTSSFFRDIQYVRSLIQHCKHSTTRPGLLHLVSASQYWLPYFFSFRRLGLPIVESHTILDSLSTRKWKRYLQRPFWRLPYQFADCIVTPNMVGRDALREIGVTRRIEVIPNGLNLNRFKPIASTEDKMTLRKRLGLNPTAKLILFVGALIERKGIDILIKAWQLIAKKSFHAYLIVVGPKPQAMGQELGMTDFQKKIENLIISSGVAEQIIFIDQVKNIEEYFQAADLFIFPSQREGSPNAVLEAFGCGLATILTPFIGLSDELGYPDQHYLLVERTPEALAKAMIALLERPELQHQLGSQSCKWVEANMDIESSLDKYANLYRELIDRSKNKGRLA